MGISTAQALDCFNSNDLLGIGMEADAIRRSFHPEGVVTYLIDCRLPLTAGNCSNLDAIFDAARETLDLGGTGLHLELPNPQPDRPEPIPSLADLESILIGLRERFPALYLHGLSATSILALSQASGITLRDTLSLLRDAGLNSLGGEDATLAANADTNISRSSHIDLAAWFEVHRTAHQLGLCSSAAMAFGLGESVADRIHHLEALRAFQQETGGFTSFTPLACTTANRAQRGVNWEPPTAVEYLRTLAIARLILDNIPHIQSSNTAQGLKVVQMALRFGSDDVGSISLHGDATHHGSPNRISEEDLRRVIRDAGFRPAQRDTGFRTLYLSN